MPLSETGSSGEQNILAEHQQLPSGSKSDSQGSGDQDATLIWEAGFLQKRTPS